MFTWICPKCGAEVPPAYDECPRCSPPKAKAEPQPDAPAATPPVAEAAAPPPPPAPRRAAILETPVPAAPAPRAPAAPSAKTGMPAWMASLLTALAMALVIAIVYFTTAARSDTAEAAKTEATKTTSFEPASAMQGSSPFAKHLELAGFRMTEDKNQKLQVRFLVVNHSNAELPPLNGSVSIKTGRADTTIELPFKLPSLGPQESREVTSTTKVEIRAYELPDWQFIRPEFTVTEAEK